MDLLKLGFREGFNPENRIVKQSTIKNSDGELFVSTVDLGLDHGFGETPLYYETMVFIDGRTNIYMDRYTTREESEIGHEKVIKCLESGMYEYEDNYIEFY